MGCLKLSYGEKNCKTLKVVYRSSYENKNSCAGAYRYGFNKGSEKDDEISGPGNHITTFYREGDLRLGLWWGTDPKAIEQLFQSPYNFMNGNPIWHNDPLGDKINKSKNLEKNKDWNKSYNTWSKSNEGKEFIKNFGDKGKLDHINVNFDVKKIEGGENGNTTTSIFDIKNNTTIFSTDKNFESLAQKAISGDKNFQMNINITLNSDVKPTTKLQTATSALTILHETQHARINVISLRDYKMKIPSYSQHKDYMDNKKSNWYNERYNFFKDLKPLWQESKPENQTDDKFIKGKISDFMY